MKNQKICAGTIGSETDNNIYFPSTPELWSENETRVKILGFQSESGKAHETYDCIGGKTMVKDFRISSLYHYNTGGKECAAPF